MRVDQGDKISELVDRLDQVLRQLDDSGEIIAALRVSEAVEALQASNSYNSSRKHSELDPA